MAFFQENSLHLVCYNGCMRVENLEGMGCAASDFIKTLMPKKDGAVIFGLSGELGSGKTTFVQNVAEALGIEQAITSPTFVILKSYQLIGQKFDSLIHVDAYRLEEGSELASLDWQTYIKNPKNLILVEWPERVKEALPVGVSILSFTFIDETTREIIFPND